MGRKPSRICLPAQCGLPGGDVPHKFRIRGPSQPIPTTPIVDRPSPLRGYLRSSVIKDEIQSGAVPSSHTSDEAQFELAAPLPPSAASAGTPASELTPFMRQWTLAKRENPDALLFF